jgi:spore germination protein YaaH
MPHAEQAAETRYDSDRPALDGYVPSRDPADRPDVTVYGYWPYWGESLGTLPWDQLTHVALFGVELTEDGTLAQTHRWTKHAQDALQFGGSHDVKIHLTLISFTDDVQASVLPDPERRARAISELSALLEAEGGHGLNIDIEGLNSDLKDDFVTFVEECSQAFDEVVVAMPAIDWSGSYDYDALSNASDGLFIMGYGYHWSGGSPGPIAPLYGGGVWGERSLSWSVEDYRAYGATDDKIILGLPLYGRQWGTHGGAVPGSATSEGSAVTYSAAIPVAQEKGRLWDAQTYTPYTYPSASEQLWYDDAESLEAKMGYAVDEGLQGFGFWALTYDDGDPDLWGRVDALTHAGR